jgi:hypothetical protein
VINFPETDEVPNSLLGTLYQEEFGYCYQSANVITIGLSQSDHIKRPPLYYQIVSVLIERRKKLGEFVF